MPVFGTDRRKFIRQNVLTLDADLDDPPRSKNPLVRLRLDSTVWVTLEDVTATFGRVTRPRNRRIQALPRAAHNETWWIKPTNIYKITPARYDNPHGFAAYVCPYADNSANFLRLGSDADFMFTGDMDGCSFGIGTPDREGHVLVGHSNAQNLATGTNFNPNFGPQRMAQLQQLVSRGAGRAIVDPAVYRDNPPPGTEYKAVTVGLRIHGKWEFWYQHQNVDGTELRDLIGVTKL